MRSDWREELDVPQPACRPARQWLDVPVRDDRDRGVGTCCGAKSAATA
jgi:hypothetical protein